MYHLSTALWQFIAFMHCSIWSSVVFGNCDFNHVCISSSDARPSKLRRIDDFKRNLPYISASALTALIADIKEKGPPEVASRKVIAVAAKNAVNCDLYGPLLMESACKLTNGQSKQICHVNPLTLIAALFGKDGAFGLLLETLAKKPCALQL